MAISSPFPPVYRLCEASRRKKGCQYRYQLIVRNAWTVVVNMDGDPVRPGGETGDHGLTIFQSVINQVIECPSQ
ncbi:MAG: hypothetical protein JAY99_13115 [Candidatus Thiodiazotropha lotti]|nr:hypothetical protein [Candidatus Thiodiazotropha lotti]MCG8000461.1 hypothetical protein [Candidatus Thiodiazotropha lotti]MCW4183468.1 hypothetical protein [Candidatus Thiodiazotropha weberae]MCW4192231.1 hypothetical protein [Candidatus Thiodiazotropha weberae]